MSVLQFGIDHFATIWFVGSLLSFWALVILSIIKGVHDFEDAAGASLACLIGAVIWPIVAVVAIATLLPFTLIVASNALHHSRD